MNNKIFWTLWIIGAILLVTIGFHDNKIHIIIQFIVLMCIVFVLAKEYGKRVDANLQKVDKVLEEIHTDDTQGKQYTDVELAYQESVAGIITSQQIFSKEKEENKDE